MKMKSIFSNVSAKLALAVLAVGTMFTSCYDSENGDVTVPTKPAEPTYTVNGVVTDFRTGEAIEGATVAIASVGTETTDATGSYTYQGTAPVNGQITISAAGYRDVVRTIKMPTVETGAVVFTVNAALIGEYDLPGIEATVMETASSEVDADALFAEDPNYETVLANLVNNTPATITLPLTVNNLKMNGKFVNSGVSTKAAEDDARNAFIAYCQSNLGVDPSKGYMAGSQVFNIEINPWTEVTALSFKGYAETVSYSFPYEGVEYTYTIEYVSGYSCEPSFHTFGHGHYHGHGHGTGGELNAGGGIWE